MQKLLLTLGLFVCLHVSAQLPEDALRFSRTIPSGTAREQAIGGAMGSLGGEISSGFVNPAGLGFYKTDEIVVTPGWHFLLNKSSYLDTRTTSSVAQNFNLGTSGVVFSYPGRNPGVSNAFAIAVNRTADFYNNIHYKGENAYSSFAEQYAEEFANSGLSIDNAIGNASVSYGTRMALYSYLIDTATVNGVLQVIAQPQKAGRVLQDNTLQTRGGITEIDLSLGSGKHDKFYIGGSLGIPILNYTRYQTYTESDATGNPNNDFDYFTYKETYTTSGWGLNAKLGAIFRPASAWRIGLAIHTPNMMGLTDKISASMITRTENYTNLQQVSISSDSLDRLTGVVNANSVNYDLYTPWKFLLSGSYVFGAGKADTRQQKGFITADLEYATTNDANYRAGDVDNGVTGNDYYSQVNQAIKASYKGTLAAHLGGEMKFHTLMVRAGAAYYTSPYRQSDLKGDRLYLSAGAGYRNKGFFLDLAYIMGFSRDINVPYRLSDKLNSYAALKEYAGTVVLTAGIKL